MDNDLNNLLNKLIQLAQEQERKSYISMNYNEPDKLQNQINSVKSNILNNYTLKSDSIQPNVIDVEYK